MRSSLFFFAAALSLSVASVACSGAPNDGNETPDSTEADIKSGASVQVTESADGTTVSLDAGQKLVVKLSSNASTGYFWMVKTNDLAAPKQGTIPGDVDRPGSPGFQTFTFDTTGASGSHVIELVYQRPWAELTPPAKTFSVTLDIAGKVATARCGGLAGLSCKSGEFCDYSDVASCGMADQMGTCKPKPAACPRIYAPVCGCDGNTHSNACDANFAGTAVAHDGACE